MPATLSGPDVSHYQGLVNWAAVRAAGHSFAIAKATEGTGFRDTRFPQNWPSMAAAGLVRGAYHFLRDGNGAGQARHFVATVGDLTGALAVVDTERPASGGLPAIDDVRAFADEFRRLVPGHPLIVYTGRWYWVGVIGNPYGADVGPLWHSEYDGVSPIDFDVANGPELDQYGGWNHATIWQHTSSGTCPGISGRCDLNLFYGTAADLAALTGARPAIPPPPALEVKTVDITSHEGYLHEIVIGQDHGVWHLYAPEADGLGAAQIESLGGQARAVTATWHGDQYVVVAHGFPEDGGVERAWQKVWDATDGTWSDWTVQPSVWLVKLAS